MQPVRLISGKRAPRLILTCEHASCDIPIEYEDLDLDRTDIEEHIGWDIGAAALSEMLAAELDAPAVLSGVSRLVIDCNRDLSDHDLIVAESHGVGIPGNARVDRDERARRVRDFYVPYHAAVDALLRQHRAFLLSIHSFTPLLNGRERRFDAGVLFDEWVDDAQRFGAALSENGLRVRYNEPYSGLDGLIYSARRHGQQHQVRYLELEINNRLLREPPSVRRVAEQVSAAVRSLLEM